MCVGNYVGEWINESDTLMPEFGMLDELDVEQEYLIMYIKYICAYVYGDYAATSPAVLQIKLILTHW